MSKNTSKTLIFIGLGKMGKNIIFHLLESEISLKIYNRTKSVSDDFISLIEQENSSNSYSGNIQAFASVSELLQDVQSPRVIFLMVKAGQAVDDVIQILLDNGCQADDIIIDGGNSFYEDSKRRQEQLKAKKIHFIDCGTSGGLEGARYGSCLMLGGDKDVVSSLAWLWDALTCRSQVAPHSFSNGSWEYMGASGAGHFVKMIHNGIEYGMNQAIAEGFDLLSKSEYQLDYQKVAQSYARGSVIRGWLMELLERAFSKDHALLGYKGVIGGGETGSFVLKTAQKLHSPQPILAQAIESRNQSQSTPSFGSKIVAALRFEYGGHEEPQ